MASSSSQPYMLEERTVRGLHDFIADQIAGMSRSRSILDLGCGSGAWLERLRQLGFSDLTGVDVDPPPGRIRGNLNEPMDFARRFSLITAIEVIEHLSNPGALLQTAANALEDEGVFVVTTPNIHSLSARIRFASSGRLPFFDEKSDPTHVLPMYVTGLTRLAGLAGLRMESISTYPENRPLSFSLPVRACAAAFRLVMRDDLPGDTLHLVFRRIPAA